MTMRDPEMESRILLDPNATPNGVGVAWFSRTPRRSESLAPIGKCCFYILEARGSCVYCVLCGAEYLFADSIGRRYANGITFARHLKDQFAGKIESWTCMEDVKVEVPEWAD